MMIDKERIEELTDLLLAEGELALGEAAELRAALAESETARALYLARCEMNFALGEAAELGVLGKPESAAPKVSVPNLVSAQPPADPAPSPKNPAPIERPRPGFGPTLLKLAAVLALGAGTLWFAITYNDGGSPDATVTAAAANQKGGKSATSAAVEDPSVESAPDVEMANPEIARTLVPEPEVFIPDPVPATSEAAAPSIHREPMVADGASPETGETPVPEEDASTVLGLVWSVDDSSGVSDTSSEWVPGAEVTAGEYTIARGTVEIRLASGQERQVDLEADSGFEEDFPAGVRLVLQGPTRFALPSADRVQLYSGKLSAEVFPSAKGFTVSANAVEAVDLGTRFAVTANTKGDVAVHVYDGTVTGKVADASGAPATIRSGETVRLDLDASRLEKAAFQSSLFAPRPAWKGGIEEHDLALHLLDRPPRELDRRLLSPGEQAVIFRERSGIVLRRALEVNLPEPGRIRPPANDSTTIPV